MTGDSQTSFDTGGKDQTCNLADAQVQALYQLNSTGLSMIPNSTVIAIYMKANQNREHMLPYSISGKHQQYLSFANPAVYEPNALLAPERVQQIEPFDLLEGNEYPQSLSHLNRPAIYLSCIWSETQTMPSLMSDTHWRFLPYFQKKFALIVPTLWMLSLT